MFDRRVAALFPLPLSAFERYMLSDDRPDYPMVFATQLRLSGEIDRPAFESSFGEARLASPLAVCAGAAPRGPARSGCWPKTAGRPSIGTPPARRSDAPAARGLI